MDREDLDKEVKEHGALMEQKYKGSKGRRRGIAAVAVLLILAGAAGGLSLIHI